MKKWIIAIAGLIVILIVSVILMNNKYFYTPFTYPNGLINDYTHSFKDFKKPIQIYVEKKDSSAEYEHMYSKRISDDEIVSKLLNHFDSANELKHINNDNYIDFLDEIPEEDKVDYRVFVQGNMYEGRERDLFVIHYFEGEDFFYINNDRYFRLTPEFRNDLNKAYQTVEWNPWP